MKALGHYAAATLLVVTVAFGVMWPFMDGPGRTSLLVATAITVPVQWASFLLVVRALGEPTRFLLRWGIGILARMGAVGAVGLLLPRLAGVDGSVLLLSVCGFFFVFLLLEPVFFPSKGTERFAQ